MHMTAPVTTLMERSYAGLIVELRLVGEGEVFIAVKDGEKEAEVVRVDPAKALDAFHHPFCYLPR